jgi:hypothetical protein
LFFSRLEYDLGVLDPLAPLVPSRSVTVVDESDPLDMRRMDHARDSLKVALAALQQHWAKVVLQNYRFSIIHCISEFTYYPQIVEVMLFYTLLFSLEILCSILIRQVSVTEVSHGNVRDALSDNHVSLFHVRVTKRRGNQVVRVRTFSEEMSHEVLGRFPTNNKSAHSSEKSPQTPEGSDNDEEFLQSVERDVKDKEEDNEEEKDSFESDDDSELNEDEIDRPPVDPLSDELSDEEQRAEDRYRSRGDEDAESGKKTRVFFVIEEPCDYTVSLVPRQSELAMTWESDESGIELKKRLASDEKSIADEKEPKSEAVVSSDAKYKPPRSRKENPSERLEKSDAAKGIESTHKLTRLEQPVILIHAVHRITCHLIDVAKCHVFRPEPKAEENEKVVAAVASEVERNVASACNSSSPSTADKPDSLPIAAIVDYANPLFYEEILAVIFGHLRLNALNKLAFLCKHMYTCIKRRMRDYFKILV